MIDQKSTPDRRAADRFPLEREVRFKTLARKGHEETGTGKTLNMSSNGILFESTTPLLLGSRLELSVNWPAKLNDTCPLKLVAKARIVRSSQNTAAAEILQHEFRTVKQSEAARMIG